MPLNEAMARGGIFGPEDLHLLAEVFEATSRLHETDLTARHVLDSLSQASNLRTRTVVPLFKRPLWRPKITWYPRELIRSDATADLLNRFPLQHPQLDLVHIRWMWADRVSQLFAEAVLQAVFWPRQRRPQLLPGQWRGSA